MTDSPMANHLAVEEGRELVRVADVGHPEVEEREGVEEDVYM